MTQEYLLDQSKKHVEHMCYEIQEGVLEVKGIEKQQTILRILFSNRVGS